MKKPVIIDCAPGAYEGLALALAAKSALDIRAVTVNGIFESAEKALGDVSAICAAVGITAPVVMGAAEPVIAGVRPVIDRYPRLPEGFLPSADTVQGNKLRYAWDEIYDQAETAEGELTLICLGSLTNLAIALFKYPELVGMLREVIFYGGALDWGNVSQTAEVNLAADPHAADALSKSGIPTTMIPWSEACKAELTLPMGEGSGVVARLAALLQGREKIPLEQPLVANHALAVLYAAEVPCFETKRHIIRVETRSTLCMGRTCPNLMYSLKKDPPNMNVVRRVDPTALQDAIKLRL